MSSPKVITAVRVPRQQALAANREDIAHYLTLAREIYDQSKQVERETLARGGTPARGPALTPQEAEAKAWSEYRSDPDGGYRGVQFAHAYWQSLKHPWQEQTVKRLSEAVAAETQRGEREQARLEELLVSVRTDFQLQHKFTVQEMGATSYAPGRSWSKQISETVDAIVKASAPDKRASVQQALHEIAGKDPQEMWLALQTERIAVEQEAKRRHREEALSVYQERQRDLTAERMERQMERCAGELEGLEAASAADIEAQLAEVRAALGRNEASADLEDHLEAVARKITAETRQQGLLAAAVTALRRQGYEAVQVMNVIGPAEVASVYLQDPRDVDRVALIQVAEGRGIMSAEVVRRKETVGSGQEQKLDLEAQARLCQAMEAAEQALSEMWQCSVLQCTEPGAVPQVKTDISPRSKRVRASAGFKSRSLG